MQVDYQLPRLSEPITLAALTINELENVGLLWICFSSSCFIDIIIIIFFFFWIPMAVIWLLQICMSVYVIFLFFFLFVREREREREQQQQQPCLSTKSFGVGYRS